MRCFAISDLHLSLSGDKPMHLFGDHWYRHWEKIESHWRNLISEQDLVLLPGDHSWAMNLDEAQPDLEFIASLPGIKVLSKGNHDYWWSSISKLRKRFPALHFIQNDALIFEDIGICGTRGWSLPGPHGFEEEHDEKIYRREIERLKMSIKALSPHARVRIAMLHYPPLLNDRTVTDFTRILEEGRIDYCVYGHLHLEKQQTSKRFTPVKGTINNVHYELVSCDYLEFRPLELSGISSDNQPQLLPGEGQIGEGQITPSTE